ncbi:MAG: hypothetical protein K2W95_12220 [Candidatus Obscuribacterales bacterium]|nr:hypothetical protein [Candidatus Obscuribacterales bacterium]
MFVVHVPAYGQEQVRNLNSEGIRLYRAKDYEKAVDVFKQAIGKANPDSLDELSAYENLVVAAEAERMTSNEIWPFKRKLWLLRSKLRGQAIPPEYDASTSEEGRSNLSKRQAEQRRGAEQRAKADYEKMLDSRQKTFDNPPVQPSQIAKPQETIAVSIVSVEPEYNTLKYRMTYVNGNSRVCRSVFVDVSVWDGMKFIKTTSVMQEYLKPGEMRTTNSVTYLQNAVGTPVLKVEKVSTNWD